MSVRVALTLIVLLLAIATGALVYMALDDDGAVQRPDLPSCADVEAGRALPVDGKCLK